MLVTLSKIAKAWCRNFFQIDSTIGSDYNYLNSRVRFAHSNFLQESELLPNCFLACPIK